MASAASHFFAAAYISQLQDIRARPQLRLNLVQFYVGLSLVVQFEPALRGLQVEAVGRCRAFIVRLSRRSAEDGADQPGLLARRLATRSMSGGWVAK